MIKFARWSQASVQTDLDDVDVLFSDGLANLDRPVDWGRMVSISEQHCFDDEAEQTHVSLSENLVTLHLHSGSPSLAHDTVRHCLRAQCCQEAHTSEQQAQQALDESCCH